VLYGAFMQKNTLKNIIKIVKCLEESKNDWIWLTAISKRVNLHRTTVSRLIDKHLSLFVEQNTVEPFNIRMIRLRPDANLQTILRFLSVKEKIKKTS
jgi:hypothetical protein